MLVGEKGHTLLSTPTTVLFCNHVLKPGDSECGTLDINDYVHACETTGFFGFFCALATSGYYSRVATIQVNTICTLYMYMCTHV